MKKRYFAKVGVAVTFIIAITFSNCKKAILAAPENVVPPETVGVTPPLSAEPFKAFLGVNAFEWDYTTEVNHGQVDEARFQIIKSFSGIRHYLDWQRIENKEGSFTYSPSHYGDWDYDQIYQRMKDAGKDVLIDLKGCPDWLLATYPVGQRDGENVPAPYGLNRSQPATYIKQARVGFQLAARYGSNKNVDKSLLLADPTVRWRDDPQNLPKAGLGLITYIECDNERDKWWKGPLAQQSAEEYAANLSAFYDGHKGTLGKGIGVKNADPNMIVVMGGIADANPEFVRKMVQWCKTNRGTKANGQIDLCFDVVNYHQYANDAFKNNGNATVGLAPELSDLGKVASLFKEFAKSVNGGIPVWVTETGYDVGEHTPQRAIKIGSKSSMITQADWNMRTALLYARSGISKCMFYMLDNVDVNSWTQYSSSGFINPDFSRRPSADYVLQANKLIGEYHYSSTISKDPLVDVYMLNGKKTFVLTIPDQVGRSKTYDLDLGSSKEAIVYSFAIGKDQMDAKTVATKNGTLQILVTETPIFIQAK
ncbi:hypothetical protein ASE74_13470 [Pedobacter sp. Leaf216]|uniref:hypothetical protein n=1 Tax=Pedobacter sp. Leaf216 TaxID=1735684 RepID=UPI0006F87AFA|nr:hypothetical protein [Pedobacter sp. Leaf216]KQM78508.1 hypothetical protein ASE74_13470 [Pedobacter sp. Leaf216]